MRNSRRSRKRWVGADCLPPVARLLTLLLLLWATPAISQEDYKIRSVSFEGNAALSADNLKDQMSQKGKSWFAEKIRRQEVFFYSGSLMDKDVEALKGFYQREGFLDARVEAPRIEQNDANQTLKLRFVVDEGNAVFIRSIKEDVVGDSAVARLIATFRIEHARDAFIRTGARFRDEDVLKERRRILDHLSESGYPYAAVEHRPSVTASRDSVDMTWRIAGGPLCVFGPPKITGNQRISNKLIAGKITFSAGDRFKGSKLSDSQRQIYSLGQFSVVSFKPALSEDHPAIVPVDVVIREAPRTKAKIGAGYGKEDGFRGFLEFERLGFLGGARKLTLYTKHSSLEPININLTFTQPDIPLKSLVLVLRPYYLRQDEPGYSLDRFGSNATIERGLSADLYGAVTYTLEKVDLQSSAGTDTVIQGEAGQDSLYDKSSVSFAITRTTGKPAYDPIRGTFNAIRLMYSGLPPSRYEFVKVIWDTRRYDELREGLVMASRAKMGYLRSFDADEVVPVEERFNSGGSNSVRGWERSTLGPLDEEGRPLGGKSLLEGSIELRWGGTGKLTPVAMFDLGNVWEQTGHYPLDELQYSAGVGVRYPTPIGPLRLDVAKPVFRAPLPTQWHFSIGQAF
jgi:outer membrane protein assembly complex protein YaeT